MANHSLKELSDELGKQYDQTRQQVEAGLELAYQNDRTGPLAWCWCNPLSRERLISRMVAVEMAIDFVQQASDIRDEDCQQVAQIQLATELRRFNRISHVLLRAEGAN